MSHDPVLIPAPAIYGGTGASSPILASVYALAGNPGAMTIPEVVTSRPRPSGNAQLTA